MSKLGSDDDAFCDSGAGGGGGAVGWLAGGLGVFVRRGFFGPFVA